MRLPSTYTSYGNLSRSTLNSIAIVDSLLITTSRGDGDQIAPGG